MDQFEHAKTLLDALASGGAFLVTGSEKPNVMTIGWGALAQMWNLPMMEVLVRSSRYTYGLLEKDPRFTVAIPKAGGFKKEIAVCGVKSGRDADKFAECGLKPATPQNGGIAGIEGCLNIECRSIHSIHVPVQGLRKDLVDRFYPHGDEHTMYFGEILAIY